MEYKGAIWAAAVLAMVTIGATAVGSVSAQDQTTMTVNVTDQGGEPLGDIEVTAYADDSTVGTDVTRSNGNALIDVPLGESIAVELDDPEGEFVKNVRKQVDDPTERVDVQMAPPGTIDFSVTERGNSEPIEGVTLRVKHTTTGEHDDGERVGETETDSAGIADISEIEQRAYTVETSKPGYLNEEISVTLDRSSVSEELDLESRNVEVEFNVTDSYLDSPLDGVTVSVDDSSAGTTQSDGTQITRLAVNDDYEITADKDGYDAVTETLRLGEESTTFGVEIRRTPEANIEPLQTAVVTGQQSQVTITNAYGDPVPDAEVSLNGDAVGTTNEQGMIQFEVSSAGENTVSVSVDGLENSITIDGVDQAVETADDDTADGDTDSFGPGFGVIAVLAGIVGLAVLATRRRSHSAQ